MTIKMRPHHLLCTQSYEGMGYSEEFIRHMDGLTGRLRTEEATEIILVNTTDEICAHCPNMLGADCCREQEKVKELDRRVVEAFGLEEKLYDYRSLVREIRRQMTPGLMDQICGSCSWYSGSSCRRIIALAVEEE